MGAKEKKKKGEGGRERTNYHVKGFQSSKSKQTDSNSKWREILLSYTKRNRPNPKNDAKILKYSLVLKTKED